MVTETVEETQSKGSRSQRGSRNKKVESEGKNARSQEASAQKRVVKQRREKRLTRVGETACANTTRRARRMETWIETRVVGRPQRMDRTVRYALFLPPTLLTTPQRAPPWVRATGKAASLRQSAQRQRCALVALEAIFTGRPQAVRRMRK